MRHHIYYFSTLKKNVPSLKIKKIFQTNKDLSVDNIKNNVKYIKRRDKLFNVSF